MNTILNPPDVSAMEYDNVKDKFLINESHSKYYGYLCRFIEYQREIAKLSQKHNLSIIQFISLQDGGLIKDLGWVEEYNYRNDLKYIFNLK